MKKIFLTITSLSTIIILCTAQSPRIVFCEYSKFQCYQRKQEELIKMISNIKDLDSAYNKIVKYFNAERKDAFVLICFDCPGIKARQFPVQNKNDIRRIQINPGQEVSLFL